jgi:predicted RNA methylase
VSAANRPHASGALVKRKPADDYPTPAWVTRAILPHLITPRTVLEPAAGEGMMMRVLRANWTRATIDGVEIDRDRARKARNECYNVTIDCGNALDISWDKPVPESRTAGCVPYDLIITNPPFSHAMPFVEKALASGAQQCAFLLRLAFLESKARAAFHRANPSDIYVLPERPSFVWAFSCSGCDWAELLPCGTEVRHCPRDEACPGKVRVTKNDMAAYAWFTWTRGSPGGRWFMLDV